MSHFKDKLFIGFQYLAPQQFLSSAAGCLAECETTCVKNFFIKHFIRQYGVNMAEAAEPDYTQYKNFNAFFTRALAQGVRPMAAGNSVISPADGAISQLGNIEDGRIFQAKGQCYTALELLAGNQTLAQHFTNGIFATIYLSPRDYHRVHAPISGTLSDMIYVPGDLFSVNTTTANHVPRLFSRNERLITVFDTEMGKVAVVLVGAMIVAGIETAWAGQITPPRKKSILRFETKATPVQLQKGDELGRFKLGSTAILLFEKDKVRLNETLNATSPVRMGDALAAMRS